MNDYDDSVMIALLPTTTDWCKIELPHLTLVYAGKAEDLLVQTHNEMTKAALDLAIACPPLALKVVSPDVFGDEEKVDVLRLEMSPQLMAMRSIVEQWNASQHPFNPHVTVGPVGSLGSDHPYHLVFDRILVAWGNSHLAFTFGSGKRVEMYKNPTGVDS